MMALRPTTSATDPPLTKEQVAELHRHLAGIDPLRVIRTYQQAYEQCRLHGELLPNAPAIQTLVTAWKVLRERRRKRG